jgi:hypothetical protein
MKINLSNDFCVGCLLKVKLYNHPLDKLIRKTTFDFAHPEHVYQVPAWL